MMSSVMEHLGMGGYAGFVWPAYALALVGLIGTVLAAVQTLRGRQREFEILKGVTRPAPQGSVGERA
jgi:heme exporter protein D